jgi:1-acyl-sn-glycerol-3-phosphate acyltransferase
MEPLPQPELPPAVSLRRQWANYLFFLPMVGVVTGSFGAIALVCGLWDKHGSQQHKVARCWAKVMLRLSFAPVRLEHAERFPQVAAVYVCNHLSYYDTPVLYAKLPFQFRILAKAPLWSVPVIGWYLQRSGQVAIDQTLESGLSLTVFPEGGRAADGQLQAMMAGAAWIAIKAGTPIVPLTLVGTYELLPIHVYALKPRPLKLIVGDPISTAGMTTKNAEALMAQLRAVIHATYMAEQR